MMKNFSHSFFVNEKEQKKSQQKIFRGGEGIRLKRTFFRDDVF